MSYTLNRGMQCSPKSDAVYLADGELCTAKGSLQNVAHTIEGGISDVEAGIDNGSCEVTAVCQNIGIGNQPKYQIDGLPTE